MTNFEKYKDEILKITAMGNSTIAVKDGMLVTCKNLLCRECDFKDGDCIWNRFNWLYEDDGEEPDGCDGCKYEHKREDESPCTDCRNNYTSKWERRPKKTRQDEFLEHYPNAQRRFSSALDVCPNKIDTTHLCEMNTTCLECKKDYWLQEVEDKC